RRTSGIARFQREMDSENPADNVFVDVHAEGESDLLGNALAAPGAIAAFHFDDRADQLFRRSFGTGSTDSFGRKQQSVFLLDQHFMKTQQSRGLLRRQPTAKHARGASIA